MSVPEMVAILLVAVLSFFAGGVWGVFVSGRNWRRAHALFSVMRDCTGAMGREILRLRDLVSSLGGDPGPEPPYVRKRPPKEAGHDR